MHSFFKSLKLNWLFIAVLIFSFAPVLFFHFQYHNDLGFWYDREFGPHPETGHLFYFGRPLGGFLLDVQTNLMRLYPTLTALTLSRLFSLVLALIFFLLVEKILTKYTSFSKTQRAFFLLFIALQPSWLEPYVWVASLVPGFISYILGIMSSLMFPETGTIKRQRSFLSALLLSCAFLIYPPGACVFFWGLLLQCTFQKELPSIKEIFRHLVFFGGICALCLTIHKTIVMNYVCGSYWIECKTWEPSTSTAYSWDLIRNPFDKIETLWNLVILTATSWVPLLTKLDFFNAAPGLIVIAFAFGPYAGFEYQRITLKDCARGFIYNLFFFLIFNSPNLITKASVISFRTVAPNTIFIGIGLIKILSLIKNDNFQKLFSFLISISFASLCLFVSLKLVSHYQTAWNEVSSNLEVTEVCKNGPKTGQRMKSIPVVSKYLEPYYKNELDGFDFDLPVFLQDSTPAICTILETENRSHQ